MTSSLKGSKVPDPKKRLSTIEGSPAVAEKDDEDKENDTMAIPQEVAKPMLKRPGLPHRMSTNSIRLEGAINEMRVVREMLRGACEGDDMEVGAHRSELSGKLARTDLIIAKMQQAKQTEATTGRMPSLADILAEVQAEAENDLQELSGEELTSQLLELKKQLDQKTAQILDLQQELQKFGDAASADSVRIEQHIEAAGREHTKKVNEMLTKHQEEVSALQAQLAEKAAVDDSQATDLLASQSQSHAEALAKLDESHSSVVATYEEQIAGRDRELESNGAVITHLQDEIIKHQHAKSDEIKNLSAQHESKVAMLMEQLKKLRLRQSSSESDYQSSVTTYVDKINDLESRLSSSGEEREQALLNLQSKHEKEHKKLIQKYSDETESHIAKLKEAEEGLSKERQSLQTSSDDLNAAKEEVEELKRSLEHLSAESERKSEIDTKALLEMQENADKAAAALVESHVNSIKAQEEHESVLAALNDEHMTRLHCSQEDAVRRQEEALSELQCKHESALADSTKMITDLQEQHYNEIQEEKGKLERKHEENIKEMNEIYLAKAAHVDRDHQEVLTALKTTHDLALAQSQKLLDDQVSAKETQLDELKAILTKQKSDLQDMAAEAMTQTQHMSELIDVKNRLLDIESQNAKLTENLEAKILESSTLKTKLETINGSHAKEIARMQERINDFANKKLDNDMGLQEAERRAQTAEEALNKALNFQHTSIEAIEAAQRRAKVAEDSLAKVQAFGESQEDSLMKAKNKLKDVEIALAKSKASTQSHFTTLAAANKKASEAEEALRHARDSIKSLEDIKSQLGEAKVTIAKQQRASEEAQRNLEELKTSSDMHQGDAKATRAKYEAVQKDIAEAEIAGNKILEEMKLAQSNSEAAKTKIIELESALKVTKAELTEARTQRSKGVDFLNPTKKASETPNLEGREVGNGRTPTRTQGMSEPASEDTRSISEEAASPATPSNANGSVRRKNRHNKKKKKTTEGMVAGVKEQIRQLQDISDDFKDDHDR